MSSGGGAKVTGAGGQRTQGGSGNQGNGQSGAGNGGVGTESGGASSGGNDNSGGQFDGGGDSGGDAGTVTGTGGAGGTGTGGTGTGGTGTGGTGTGGTGTGGTGTGGTGTGGGNVPLPLTCTLPFQAASVANPTTVVGQGGVTCDEAGVAAAVKNGGIVTFDCGDNATITLTAPLAPPKGKNTTIDGGGHVTLDGGGTTRLLKFKGGNYRVTTTIITLQHLKFQNGFATGTKLPDPPQGTDCSEGYDIDAGGGDVYIQDAKLHVFDCTFSNSAGTSPRVPTSRAAASTWTGRSVASSSFRARSRTNTASNGGALAR